MIYRILFLLAFASMSAGTYAADVYKWIDDKGRTQYGESVPAKFKKSATKVDVTIPEPTEAQRQEAAARAVNDKAAAESLPANSAKPAKPRSAPPPPAVASADARTKQCEADWKKYRESEACFAPYKSKAGSISPEAFQHCVEVKEPTC